MNRLLDMTTINTTNELHDYLADFFGFPDYYGRNWDAFDECLADFPPNGILTIRGINHLQSVLPRDASLFTQSIDRVAAEDAGFTVKYELTM